MKREREIGKHACKNSIYNNLVTLLALLTKDFSIIRRFDKV